MAEPTPADVPLPDMPPPPPNPAEQPADVPPAPKRRGRPPGSKNKTTTARPAADKPPRTTPRKPLEPRLKAAIGGLGAALTMVPHELIAKDGQVISMTAPYMAKGVTQYCDSNPAARDWIENRLLQASQAGLLVFLAPTVVGIAEVHGWVPQGSFGMLAQLLGVDLPDGPAEPADMPKAA
jgi:hypothetical protein